VTYGFDGLQIGSYLNQASEQFYINNVQGTTSFFDISEHGVEKMVFLGQYSSACTTMLVQGVYNSYLLLGHNRDPSCTCNGPVCPLSLQVISPSSIAGYITFTESNNSPPLRGYPVNIYGQVALTEPALACTPITNIAQVQGKFALIYRGICLFTTKIEYAEAAGAIGVIVVDEPGQPLVIMSVDPVLVPAIMISYTDGSRIASALNANMTVQVAMGPTIGNLTASATQTSEVASVGMLTIPIAAPLQSNAVPHTNIFKFADGGFYIEPYRPYVWVFLPDYKEITMVLDISTGFANATIIAQMNGVPFSIYYTVQRPSGQTLIIGLSPDDFLGVYDVSNPANMTQISGIPTTQFGYFALSQDYSTFYLIDFNETLVIYTHTNFTEFTSAGTIAPPTTDPDFLPNTVVVRQNRLWLAALDAVYVYDITTLTAPVLLGSQETEEGFYASPLFSGTEAFVANFDETTSEYQLLGMKIAPC